MGSSVVLTNGVNMNITAPGADNFSVGVLVHDGGQVLHTYSAYGVGTDVMRYITEWAWHDTYGAPDRHEHHH
jgi:hypothetical protein